MNSASEWRDTTSIRGAENHQKLSFGMEKPEIDREDPVLEHAITYILTKKYPPDLGKDQKRAVRKRAGTLVAENGEVFVVKQKRRVKVVQSVEEQKRILRACHADPTSGHFGMTKTWRRVAERFHWKGLANDVRTLVSLNSGSRVNLVRCMLGVRIVYVAS